MNTFTYTVTGAASSTTNAGMVASIGIQQITHPTSGASAARNVATVTTSVAHGFANGQNVVISNTGGVPPAGYDGTYVISGVVPGVSFTITNTNINGSPTPKITADAISITHHRRAISSEALLFGERVDWSFSAQPATTGARRRKTPIATGARQPAPPPCRREARVL